MFSLSIHIFKKKENRKCICSNKSLKNLSNLTDKNDDNIEEKNNCFFDISNKLSKFNLLTNKKLFTPVKKIFEGNIFQHKFQELAQENKNLINIKKKLKNDTMIIKCEGYDMLTKEASLIKTQEIEKDLPITKQFDKYAFCIKKGKIQLFLEPFITQCPQFFGHFPFSLNSYPTVSFIFKVSSIS